MSKRSKRAHPAREQAQSRGWLPHAKGAVPGPRFAWGRWIGFGVAGALVVAIVVAIVLAAGGSSTGPQAASGPGAGRAPDGSFTTTSGATRTISSLRGRPALVWFVTTWCSSCQAGTEAMAGSIGKFAARHVRVVELENAGNLGQPGPSIAEFGRRLAGPSYDNPAWTFGIASGELTQSYNPGSYLDIYYLLDASGHVVFRNAAPSATMNQILAHVDRL